MNKKQKLNEDQLEKLEILMQDLVVLRDEISANSKRKSNKIDKAISLLYNVIWE